MGCELCHYAARIDHRNINAPWLHLTPQGLRESMYGMFAGGIDGIRWRCNQASHGAHIDDMTRSLFYHHRQSLPRGLNYAQHVDIKLRLNIFHWVEILQPIQSP